MEIPSYARHLHGLSGPERGDVLERQGRPHQYRFRFSNPLMQPYVLMRGLQSEMVDLEDVRDFTAAGRGDQGEPGAEKASR